MLSLVTVTARAGGDGYCWRDARSHPDNCCGAGTERQFYALEGKLYSLKTHEYEYELSAFNEVRQRQNNGVSTLLGKWGRWEQNYSVMKFENGLRCWGGPDRSATVRVYRRFTAWVLREVEAVSARWGMGKGRNPFALWACAVTARGSKTNGTNGRAWLHGGM